MVTHVLRAHQPKKESNISRPVNPANTRQNKTLRRANTAEGDGLSSRLPKRAKTKIYKRFPFHMITRITRVRRDILVEKQKCRTRAKKRKTDYRTFPSPEIQPSLIRWTSWVAVAPMNRRNFWPTLNMPARGKSSITTASPLRGQYRTS